MRGTTRTLLAALAAMGGVTLASVAHAESVMQQCGQEYQAAKAANTLGGQTWAQYRSACAARLKSSPAPTPEPAAASAANPLKPAPATAEAPASAPAAPPAQAAPASAAAAPAGTKPMSAGRTAFVARERQCGAEWKAGKATLISQTPGLTWPKYLSQCNARLKAAGK